MIVDNAVQVILLLGKVVPYGHTFFAVAEVKVLRVFRQPQIVRLQRQIDDDVIWIPADCVLAWCKSRRVEPPVADSS